jgi:ribosomal-protein-alanine N-acetyltransferase
MTMALALPGRRQAPPAAFCEELAELHGCCFAHGWTAGSFAALLAAAHTDVLSWRGHGSGKPMDGFVLVRAVAGEGEILTLCVRPACRRRGLGRKLLNASLAHMLVRGAGEVFLEVAEDNLAAIGLYRAAGFEKTGRRSAYYAGEGPPKDALVMRLANIVLINDHKIGGQESH